MKKLLAFLCFALLSVVAVLGLSSCQELGYTCADLGFGHAGRWEIITEATCLEEGAKTRTCTMCGVVETEAIPALGHDNTDYEELAATCLEAGHNAYSVCARCGFSSFGEIPALGHDMQTVEAKAPTCTEDGWEEYIGCTRCDIAEVPTIPALGHTEVAHAGVEPTCTEGGFADYVTCEVCDHTTYSELAPLGHDEIAHEGDPATCLEGGFDDYVTCSRCDYTTYLYVEALGHDMQAFPAKEPTCTEDGCNAHVACTRCDLSDAVYTPALGHDEIKHEAAAPDCENVGWNEYITCSRCDLSTYEEIAALGHDEVKHAGDPPTCTTGGFYDYVTCNRCDLNTYQYKSPTGHKKIGYAKKEPTCTESGHEAYTECTRCDYTTYVELPALGHFGVDYPAKAPTCTEAGYEAHTACSRCGMNERVEIAALGHDEISHEGLAATCVEAGYEPYVTCSRCDHTTYKVIAALGHDEIAHEGVIATCSTEGYEPYVTCSRCDHTTFVSLGFAPHSEVIIKGYKSTYTETGLSDGKKCTVCNTVTLEQKIIPLVGIFTASVDYAERGSISSEGQDAVIGTPFSVTAEAKEGYRFLGWFEGSTLVSTRPDLNMEMPDTKYHLIARFDRASTSVWDGSVATSLAGGSGTEADPYIVSSAAELAYLVKHSDYKKYYKLTADIDLGGIEWTPISYFEGYFDGDGHTVTGLHISATQSSNTNGYYGLFGQIARGEVTNLRVTDADISVNVTDYQSVNIGILAGYSSYGSISKVDVEGSLKVTGYPGTISVGGLVGGCDGGQNGGISGVVARAKIDATSGYSQFRVGGIVGYAGQNISEAMFIGEVKFTKHPNVSGIYAYFGGIAGYSRDDSVKVERSLSLATLDATFASAYVHIAGVANSTAYASDWNGFYVDAGQYKLNGEAYDVSGGGTELGADELGLIFDKSFYTDTLYLGWSADAWELHCVDAENRSLPFHRVPYRPLGVDYYEYSVGAQKGGVTTEGSLYIPADVGETVVATPDVGYELEGWYLNGELVSGDNRFTYLPTANGGSLSAKFKLKDYTVSVDCSNGDIGIGGAGIYNYGNTVTLNATLVEDTRIKGWYLNGDLVSTDLSYSFTLPADDVKVELKIDVALPIVFKVENTADGSVSTEGGKFFEGDTVTAVATPAEGLIFFGWLDQDGYLRSKSESFKFTMGTKSVTYTACFVTDERAYGKTWAGGEDTQLMGKGTAENPYVITSAEELYHIASRLNWTSGTANYEKYATAYIKLAADIDLGGRQWIPLANRYSYPFKGEFDGGGHVISNFYVDGQEYGGLFGVLGYGARVSDLGVTDFEIKNCTYAGGIAGYLNGSSNSKGSVSGCYAEGAIYAASGSTGGLFGTISYSNVTYCYADVDIKGSASSGYIGGLIGSVAYSGVTSAYYSGSIEVTATVASGKKLYLGGLVGNLGGSTSLNPSSLSSLYFVGTASVETGGEGSIYLNNCIGGYSGGSVNAVYYTDENKFANGYDRSTELTVESLNSSMRLFSTYKWYTDEVDVTEGRYPLLRAIEGIGKRFYHIRVTGDNLEVVNLTNFMVSAGSYVSLYADIGTAYKFSGWRLSSSGSTLTSNPYTFSPSSDLSIRANVTRITYKVNTTSDYTTDIKLEGAGNYAPGETYTVIAPELEGYKFLGWYNSTGSVLYTAEHTYTATMKNAAVTLYAKYYKYSEMTANVNDPAFGTAAVSKPVAHTTEKVTFTATANEGYRFFGWFEGSRLVSTSATLTYTVSNADYTLTARFVSESTGWDGSRATEFSGGYGTQAYPYRISNGAELALLAYRLQQGVAGYSTAYYELTADIDLGGREWMPIGMDLGTDNQIFRGNFNGNGYTISNYKLTVFDNDSGYGSIGLFGFTHRATISDLHVKDFTVDINGFDNFLYAGGIVGEAITTVIYGCSASGSITISTTDYTYQNKSATLGGIVGNAQVTTVRDCYAAVTVTSLSSSYTTVYAGGIAGEMWNSSFAERCVSESTVTLKTNNSQNYSGIGGIAGCVRLDSGLLDCYSKSKLSLTFYTGAYSYAGHLVGYTRDEATVSDCYYSSYSSLTLSGSWAYKTDKGASAPTLTETFFMGLGYTSDLWDFDSINRYDGTGVILRAYRYGGASGGTVGESYHQVYAEAGKGGSVSAGDLQVPYGNTVRITASPLSGYRFVGWYIGDELVSLSRTVVYKASGETVLVAVFEELDPAVDSWAGEAAESFSGGSGSLTDPYLIGSAAELTLLSRLLAGEEYSSYFDKHYRLIADIYLNGCSFEPIGSLDAPFSGSLDGDGHVIYGLYVDTTEKAAGLFGYMRNASVTDLGFVGSYIRVESVNITGYAGVLAGRADDTVISGCYARDCEVIMIALAGDFNIAHAGGLVGYAGGTVTVSNCFVTGKVTAYAASNSAFAGGLIGYSGGRTDDIGTTVSDCFTDVSVYAETTNAGYTSASGIIGHSSYIAAHSISRCVVYGSCYVTSLNTNLDCADPITHAEHTNVSITDCYYLRGAAYRVNGVQVSAVTTATDTTAATLATADFYLTVLGWSPDRWSFDNLDPTLGLYPSIKY